jgi:hypothetical protein
MALFRHLRHLNLVEIPLEEPPEEGPAHETVAFRHWDPEVLAPLLPLFSDDQKARFFGVAEGVVFSSADHGGFAAVSAPSPFRPPDPSRLLLRFSEEQMEGIGEARRDASRRRIADFTERQLAAWNPRHGTIDVPARCHRAEADGRQLGLSRERALGLWCFLWIATGGAIATAGPVRDLLVAGGPDADETFEAMIDHGIGREWRVR